MLWLVVFIVSSPLGKTESIATVYLYRDFQAVEAEAYIEMPLF